MPKIVRRAKNEVTIKFDASPQDQESARAPVGLPRVAWKCPNCGTWRTVEHEIAAKCTFCGDDETDLTTDDVP